MRLALFSLLFLCSAAMASPPDWVRALAQHPRLGHASPSDRLLSRDVVIDCGNGLSPTRCRHRIVILNGGEGHWADFYHAVPFVGRNNMDIETAWLVHPDGAFEKVDKNAVIISNAQGGYALFSDQFVAEWNLLKIEVGSIIALEFTISYDPPLDCGREYLQESDGDVDSCRVTFTAKPPAAFRFRLRNFTTGTVLQNGNTFIAAALKEWKAGPLNADFRTSASCIEFQLYPQGDTTRTANSWTRIAHEMVGRWNKVDRDLDEKARSAYRDPLTAGGVSSVCSAFENHFRYVAVEIGEGGYIPHVPQQVFQFKYGDCKDLSLFLAEWLIQNGVSAAPVLVSVPASRPFMPDYPSFRQFNHVILAVVQNGDTVYYDPTARGFRYGTLPEGDQGAYALWLTENASLMTLPVDTIPLHTRRHLKGQLSARGDFEGQLSLSMDSRVPVHEWLPDDKADAQSMLRLVLREDIGFEVRSYSFDSLACSLSADVKLSGCARKVGTAYYWNVSPFRSPMPDSAGSCPESGYQLHKPRIIEDDVSLKFPSPMVAAGFSDSLINGQGYTRFSLTASADSARANWQSTHFRKHYDAAERSGLDSLIAATNRHRYFTTKLTVATP